MYACKFKGFVYFARMKFLKLICIVILILHTSMSCRKNENDVNSLPFDSIPQVNHVLPLINEISGLASSKINPGHLWANEDSGTPTQINLLKNDGTVVKQVFIKGTSNRDWEEMAIVNQDIYIAETGDNNQVYPSYAFYRFAEPQASADTIFTVEKINFTYPDGSHDAEAFLVDADTKTIFIITKRDALSRIYKLDYPYASVMVADFVGTVPYNGVTAATQSADGKEILLRTYAGIYYYQRNPGQTIAQALTNTYRSLSHSHELQGEAVCFANDGKGYYTVSEKSIGSSVDLFYYPRK